MPCRSAQNSGGVIVALGPLSAPICALRSVQAGPKRTQSPALAGDCRLQVRGDLEPGRDADLAGILVGMLGHAVERLRPGPQHVPAQVVRVALELRVEEVEGGLL